MRVSIPIATTIEVRGISVVARTWPGPASDRPSALMLPATGETAQDWDRVAATLSASRTVWAINLRGHGPSDWPGTYSIAAMADDVVGVLDGLDAGSIDLVGHSLGGLVACGVAAARPQQVRRLVLEDVGTLRPRPSAPPPRPAGDLDFDWRVVEQVRPEIDSPDPRWPAVFRAIVAPTLVIAGGPSSPVSGEQITELLGLLRDGRSVTLDAGHLVHAAMPNEFTRELATFLDQPPP